LYVDGHVINPVFLKIVTILHKFKVYLWNPLFLLLISMNLWNVNKFSCLFSGRDDETSKARKIKTQTAPNTGQTFELLSGCVLRVELNMKEVRTGWVWHWYQLLEWQELHVYVVWTSGMVLAPPLTRFVHAVRCWLRLV